ncbi:MAG: hypothetical protein K8F35_04795 [Dokdonella sp.]|uniref:hypothetical protein n=1 Tax=Dokdonella sp. TaxID=2291710 RepID=UPI0025BA1CA9|nr:hypothetical protein [Dokdonella sp.]MBZ0222325.1 hypothetical protein [Dokdonella sp.]
MRRPVRYDFENRPWRIGRLASGSLPAGQVFYQYGPSGDRFKEAATSHTTWYGAAGFKRSFTSPQTTDRIELGHELAQATLIGSYTLNPALRG